MDSVLIPEKMAVHMRFKSFYISLPSSAKQQQGVLSPGQMDSQVVARSGKLNLRRDLRWVAKRIGKFPHKYTQVAKNPFKSDISCISMVNNWLMDVTQLALTWVGWPNDEKTCVDLREKLISTKVSTSHRKSTQGQAKRRCK